MAKTIGEYIEEDYEGEMEDAVSLLKKLSDTFPKVLFSMEFISGIDKYQIEMNDFEFYMKDKKLRNWIKILRVKFPKLKFFCVFRAYSD
jgi:hypothetical protein